MEAAPNLKFTVDEYLHWAFDRPGRYELWNGEVIQMAPERATHAKTKLAMYVALLDGIRDANLKCHVMPDGMTVRIAPSTAYEPDALVYCGEEVHGDSVEIPNPVIVVEVLSPGTQRVDKAAKLEGYFSVSSVHHYLIVDIAHACILHHARGKDELIVTRIVRNGDIVLDPPGFVLRWPLT